MRRFCLTAAALAVAAATATSSIAIAQVSGAPGGSAQRSREQRDADLHRYFYQTGDTHFTMLFEGPQDAPLASRALTTLEDAYFRIASTLGYYPDDLITVVLYTEEQFRDITRAPVWAAAAFDGKIRVPIRGALEHPEELERVLAHELAHAFVHSIAPRGVPTWLNEGIAMFFEPGGAERADRRLTGTPRRLSFERLARQFGTLSSAEADLAYAQSAVITRRLFDEGGWRVEALLRDLADGVPFPDAYERRLMLPYGDFPGTREPGR
jgi:hypothetical protein